MVQRRVLQCGLCRNKKKCLKPNLKGVTGGAVGQFRGSEFQSLGAATEKRRAAVSKFKCHGTTCVTHYRQLVCSELRTSAQRATVEHEQLIGQL